MQSHTLSVFFHQWDTALTERPGLTASCLCLNSGNKTRKLQTGFPGGSDGTEPDCIAGDPGSVLGSGRFPGEGNSTPLQYACLENPMDRGAWWATVHGNLKGSDGTTDGTKKLSLSLPFNSKRNLAETMQLCLKTKTELPWSIKCPKK